MGYDSIAWKGIDVDNAVDRAGPDGFYNFRGYTIHTPVSGDWRLDGSGDFVNVERYNGATWDTNVAITNANGGTAVLGGAVRVGTVDANVAALGVDTGSISNGGYFNLGALNASRQFWITSDDGRFFGRYSPGVGNLVIFNISRTGTGKEAESFAHGWKVAFATDETDEDFHSIIHTSDPGAWDAAADTDGADTYWRTQDGGADAGADPRGGDLIVIPGAAGAGGAGRDGEFKVQGTADVTATGLALALRATNTAPVDHAIQRWVGDKSQWLDVRNKDFNHYLQWNTNSARRDWNTGRRNVAFHIASSGTNFDSLPAANFGIYILDADSVFRVGSSFTLELESIQASTSTTTGALVVDGGVGIAGAVYIGGAVDITGKLTVGGLIDPTGLEFTPVAANPGVIPANTVWIDSGDSKLYYGANQIGVAGDMPAAGSAGEVQYNSGGVLGATSNFAYNSGTDTLTVGIVAPTGVEFTPVASNPGATAADTVWINSADGKLYYGAAYFGTAAFKDVSVANGVASLDGTGKVPTSELPDSVTGALYYKGAWNANTNTPALASGVGNQGDYYVVSVAGNTNLDGITDWQVGDWAVFNGTVWEKIDNTSLINAGTVTNALVGWNGTLWVEQPNVLYDNTLATGGLYVKNTTPSTTSGTGAIRTDGGLGVAGAANVGGLLKTFDTTDALFTAGVGPTYGALTSDGGIVAQKKIFSGDSIAAVTNVTAKNYVGAGSVPWDSPAATTYSELHDTYLDFLATTAGATADIQLKSTDYYRLLLDVTLGSSCEIMQNARLHKGVRVSYQQSSLGAGNVTLTRDIFAVEITAAHATNQLRLYASPQTGDMVWVRNNDGSGTKAIIADNGGTPVEASPLKDAESACYIYNGTNWIIF